MSKRSLHSKLDGVRNLVVNKQKPCGDSLRIPDRYRLLAEAVGGEVVPNHAGSFAFVRRRYGSAYSHGTIGTVAALARRILPASAFTVEEDAESLRVEDMLFFDTETTGLGGSGAVAFLIGVGSVRDGAFEVRQYLIPDYSDETAQLEAVLEELSDSSILVSYNGAAFDLPILRDRFIVNRVGRTVPHRRHIDLLHSVRRLYRRRLGDCTLGNVERELFGFERNGDILGYLVPSVYFDWLSEQRVDDMEAVMEHNRLDIVSLFFLAGLLADAFETRGETLAEIDDLHSLSRVFGRRKDIAGVIDLGQRIQALVDTRLDEDVVLYQALAHKRAGNHDQAVDLWMQIAESDSKEACQANIQLAVHYEHRERDLQKAFECARRAERWDGLTECQRRDIRRRLSRLTLKLRAE